MKNITAETFLDFRFPGSLRISPDSKRTAMLVKQASLKENRYLCDIWVYNRETQKMTRLTSKTNVKDYCWLPGGDIVFTVSGNSEEGVSTKYFVISPEGGESQELCALPVRGGCPDVLADGSWLVSALTDLLTDDENPVPGNKTEARCADYRVFEEVPFWSNGFGDVSKRRHSLFVCDPKAGTVKRLTPKDFDVYAYDICNDTVVMTGASFDAVRPHEPGLYKASCSSLELTEILAPGKYEISSPKLLDEDTALLQMKAKGEDRYVAADLYRLGVKQGTLEMLHPCDHSMQGGPATTDCNLDSGRNQVVSEGRLYFVQTEDDESYVRSCGKDGVFSDRLTPKTNISSLDVKDGLTVVIALDGNDLPEVYSLEGGKLEKLSSFNDSVQKEYKISTPRFMSYTGSDGFEIHGWVMPPADYEPGRKYPAILNIHGGPRGVYGSVFFHEMQLWASRGYFVMFCNPRGSDGRGRDFADLYGKYGDWDYVNIMEFTDKCLELYPDIDGSRLGVTGGSYGGYMTNWIIGHTDRFKAACAQRSISNWISYEGTGDISYWFNGPEHGATLETDAQKLWDISPLKYADKAKTPTLFIHSQEDYRCYMGEGITMYTVLKMNGVDTRLVLFKGENHGLSRNGRPRPRLRRLEEIADWMDKYLKEGEKNA